MASVELKNVSKTYPGGGRPAVDGVSIEVRDGGFLVLVGPSGCGKSTTLRMIAGLETPTSGSVFIGGRDVTSLPPKDRDIAMVFQNYALYPHMTVRENLSFALKMRKRPKAEIERKVEAAAAALGLEPYLSRLPKALSGGQRQRVALGRAIVREPAVFLFDEPLSNLDARMRVETRAEIIRLHDALGATMIYVTHDQTEAMTMGERIVVMEGGRVRQAAAPLEIYERPADVFVAGFIGTPPMNIFPPGLLAPGFSVGVRPERLAVVPEGAAAPAGRALPATVDFTETLGSETLVHATLDAGGFRAVARLPGFAAFRRGVRVALVPDPGGTILFDADGRAVAG